MEWEIQSLMMKKALNTSYMQGGALEWIPLAATLMANPIAMNSYFPLTLEYHEKLQSLFLDM